MLELNNKVSGWQLRRADFSVLGWEVTDKRGQKAHAIWYQRCKHQYELLFTLVCAKLLQSFLILCDPMNYRLPGSSIHGIAKSRLLEWVAMPSSRGIFLTQGIKPVSLVSPALAGRFFTTTVTWEAQILYIHTRFWSTHRTKKIQRVLHKGFAVQRTEH